MVSPVHAEPALTPEELPNYYQGASYTMTQNLTLARRGRTSGHLLEGAPNRGADHGSTMA